MKKLFLIILLLPLMPAFTQAATLGFVAPSQVVMGEEIEVEVTIATGGENINALEGKIIWPTDKLELVKVDDVFSIVGLWLKEPKLSITTSGSLAFAGLIPSGYSEPTGQILTLVFLPRTSGQAQVRAENISVLKNDGLGTPVSTTVNELDLEITEGGAFNQHWLYILFSIVAIIISIFIWWVFHRRKKYFPV